MSVVNFHNSCSTNLMPAFCDSESQAFFLSNDKVNADADTGLVYSETSGTPEGAICVNPLKTRLKRMKHGVVTGARLHDESYSKGGFRSKAAMLTLTYRPEVVWSPRHVSELVRHIRQWCHRRGFVFRYVWVLELTKAGKPHYHLLIWLPKGVTLPKPDKQGWWKHGFTRIEWARKAVGYIAKYASKGLDEANFPKGARIHACGGLLPDASIERSWWLAPTWVRKVWPEPCYMVRPCMGGGWCSKLTGELVHSPWDVLFLHGAVYIVPKANNIDAHSEGADSVRSEHGKSC